MSELERQQRQAVVDEARSWIGTPFRHCCMVKGKTGGADCLMLIIAVFSGVGVFPFYDPRPYPTQWHLHRDDERFLAGVLRYGVERPADDAACLPGDVILWRVGRCYAHGGIIIGPDEAIHAYWRERRVCRSSLMRDQAVRHPLKIIDMWARLRAGAAAPLRQA
jgi:NlpC/P60 family putative phage cell wall peptidase